MSRAIISAINIDSSPLWKQSGAVRNWGNRIERGMVRNSKATAPVNRRSNKSQGGVRAFYPRGSLQRSISGSTTVIVAAKSLTVTVTCDVPYAYFVHEGTGALVQARDAGGRFRKGGMVLPPQPGPRARWGGGKPTPFNAPIVRKSQVKGQIANRFLARGIERTAIRHPALPRKMKR